MKPFCRALGLAGAALALVLPVGGAHAMDGDPGAGEQVAARECIGCHGIASARGTTVQGVYVPSFSEIAGRPGQSQESLHSFLSIPRHPMPGLMLREDEMRNVVAYILSLKP